MHKCECGVQNQVERERPGVTGYKSERGKFMRDRKKEEKERGGFIPSSFFSTLSTAPEQPPQDMAMLKV